MTDTLVSSVTHFVVVVDLPENQWQKAEIEGEQLVRTVIESSDYADDFLDAVNLNIKHLQEIEDYMTPYHQEVIRLQHEMIAKYDEKKTVWRQVSRTGAHPYHPINYFSRSIDVVVFFSTTDIPKEDLRSGLDRAFLDACPHVYQEIIVPDDSVPISPKVQEREGRIEVARITMALVSMRRHNEYRRSRQSR